MIHLFIVILQNAIECQQNTGLSRIILLLITFYTDKYYRQNKLFVIVISVITVHFFGKT